MNLVNGLPDRELKEAEVEALEEHGRIDRVVVEIMSDALEIPSGNSRNGLVESFWVEIDGTAHVLDYQFGEWQKNGSFKPSEVDDIHRSALEMSYKS